MLVDARTEFETNNLDTLINLEQGLSSVGREMSTAPVLLKVTHSESPSSRPPEEVAYSVNLHGYSVLSYATVSTEQRLKLHNEVITSLISHLRGNLSEPDDSPITLTPVQEKPRQIQGILGEHLKAFKQAHESARSSFDQPTWTPEDFDTLDSTSRVVLPFEVENCPNHRPSELISAAIDRGHIHLDLILENHEGEQPQRTHLVLMYQSGVNELNYSTSSITEDDSDSVTETLPMTIEITRTKPASLQSAGLSFGLIVLTSGAFLGLGLGFLLWY